MIGSSLKGSTEPSRGPPGGGIFLRWRKPSGKLAFPRAFRQRDDPPSTKWAPRDRVTGRPYSPTHATFCSPHLPFFAPGARIADLPESRRAEFTVHYAQMAASWNGAKMRTRVMLF